MVLKQAQKVKVIFFGTSSFAARILSYLLEEGITIAAVVTRPDRPRGRSMQLSPPPVKEVCLQLSSQIPIHQPEKASTPECEALLRTYEADLFVVVAYGEIIKKQILDIPKLGCVNIHASLLPKYRGAAPIQRALMDGERETGITLIEMTPKMDAGDILAIESISVPEEMTFGELEPRLCHLGCKLIRRVIDQFEKGVVVKIPQDHNLATLAPKITPQDEVIDWSKPASVIHNQIRALSPSPAAWFNVLLGNEPRRVKVKRSRVVPTERGEPGHNLTLGKEGWIVACGEGALRLLEVQMEGKRAMSTEDFVKGLHQPLQIMR